jgi:hypothetical protein
LAVSRKPTEPGGLTRVLFVRISERLDALLNELADHDPEGRSKAAIVREMIETLAYNNAVICHAKGCRTNTGRVNSNYCKQCKAG